MHARIQLKKYLGKRNSEKSVMKMKINLSNKQLNIKIQTFIRVIYSENIMKIWLHDVVWNVVFIESILNLFPVQVFNFKLANIFPIPLCLNMHMQCFGLHH